MRRHIICAPQLTHCNRRIPESGKESGTVPRREPALFKGMRRQNRAAARIRGGLLQKTERRRQANAAMAKSSAGGRVFDAPSKSPHGVLPIRIAAAHNMCAAINALQQANSRKRQRMGTVPRREPAFLKECGGKTAPPRVSAAGSFKKRSAGGRRTPQWQNQARADAFSDAPPPKDLCSSDS